MQVLDEKTKGFTLLEILVVVVIVGLISAIALPNFSDWKKDKKNIKILNTTNSGHYIHFGEPEWVITELEAYLKSLK